MGKNDRAWERLFEKYNILEKIKEDGQFVISANTIKEFREPRLMTKFDHKVNLPEILKNNSLAILPVTRGDYVISTFSAYKEFENVSADTLRVTIPAHLQSLIPKFILSESIALNCANACGILKDFLEDDDIVPTVNGRMSSGIFDFNITTNKGRLPLSINNAQIEIDAAYEGINYLSLFEAKKYISDDFLIRQLYYPFRTWQSRVTKPIKMNFLIFSNGTFYLYQYQFDDVNNYNSLRLVKHKNYTISREITLYDIEDIIKTTSIEPEPKIAFPQANSMLRIINLMELLLEKSLSKQDITTEYDFDERQTNYYTDAGRYLGLIDKVRDRSGKIIFYLTNLGINIMGQEYRERQLAIVRQILKHKAFNETLRMHLQCGEMPDHQTIIKIMKDSNLYKVKSDTTFARRSSTIMRWIEWILDIIEE